VRHVCVLFGFWQSESELAQVVGGHRLSRRRVKSINHRGHRGTLNCYRVKPLVLRKVTTVVDFRP
jgi:hypothetical protein